MLKDKEKCCGCGACYNICPKNAITMKANEEGFVYPVIDRGKCINCGLCTEVCSFEPMGEYKPMEVYAAAEKSNSILQKSASGGIFASCAREILKKKGVVFGSALEYSHGYLHVHHIAIENIQDLPLLQSSKYVQSAIEGCYRQAKEYLDSGREVLFSGTPCQIAGLYGFLRGKKYPNLFTVDIICHGVPNEVFFLSYIDCLSKKLTGTVTDFSFRDKSKGWGHHGKITYEKNKEIYEKTIPSRASSYFTYFMEGKIDQESCYHCPYAGGKRPADITLGDFWGINSLHPDYLTSGGGKIDLKKGTSCILVNSEQGKKLFQMIENNIFFYPSSLENVKGMNAQLCHPARKPEGREDIFRLYRQRGYQGVEQKFRKNPKYKIRILWEWLPFGLRKFIKKIFSR